MDSSILNNLTSYDIWQGRFALNRARIWVYCPVQPGSIRTFVVDGDGKEYNNTIKYLTWRKYNNSFWWYVDVLLNKNCTSIQIHTMSPINVNMRRITKNLDERRMIWNEIADSENLDYWQTIDLTPGSVDWGKHRASWNMLCLDPSHYLFAGTAYTFIAFINSNIGIAAL